MTYLAAGAGAVGAGLLLLSRSRSTLLVGFLALAVAEVALLVEYSGGDRLRELASSPVAPLALGAGLGALAAVAAVLVRHPIAVAPLALVAAPLRPPISFGGGGSPADLAAFGGLGRLLPLYAVLAAAVLALVWRVLRGEQVRELPRAFAIPAAAFLALVVASLLWSRDPAAAADQLIFFSLPFTALLATLARTPVRDARLVRLLAAALVVPAAIFACIGLWQAATGTVFFSSPGVEVGNAYGPLFRVTSLFDDPSHYGRHLVAAIAVVLVALWLARVRLAPAVAVLILLGAGLYFSYSQSSMVALVVVAVVLALVAGERRTRRYIATATAVVVVAGLGVLALQLASQDGRSVTSGRSRLVDSTVAVFAGHPVVGVGVAGQPAASREVSGGRREPRRYSSHTTPLTVAAELGVLGLAAYLALLVGAVTMLTRLRARDPALALGLAAVLLVLFVHSLFYEGFFDNPITWGAMALAAAGASGATARRREGATEPAADPGARARVTPSPTPALGQTIARS